MSREEFDPAAAAAATMQDVPNVNVTNVAWAADWLRGELGRGELSGLFLREGLLVHTPRIGEDGYIDPEKLGMKDAGPAQVRPVSTLEIKALIEIRYNVWRWQPRGRPVDLIRVAASGRPIPRATLRTSGSWRICHGGRAAIGCPA